MIICSQAEVMHNKHKYFMEKSAKHSFEIKKKKKKEKTETERFALTMYFSGM